MNLQTKANKYPSTKNLGSVKRGQLLFSNLIVVA